MEQKPTPEIAGLITPEEHEVLLARNEDDSRYHELRERLGDTAGMAVAILADDDEGLASYIVLDGDNHGDSIRNHEAFGLPDPTVLAREIKDQHAELRDEQGSELDAFNATLIDQLEKTKPVLDSIDTALETSRSIAIALGEAEDLWKQMKLYDQINEAGVSDLITNLSAIRDRVIGEQEPASATINQLNNMSSELEEMQRDDTLESATDLHERDRAFYAVRKIEEGLQEANAQLRSTSHMREDIVEQINGAVTQLDNMLGDSWGREAYESQISGYLNNLASDPHLQPYGSLSRMQAALEDVGKIKLKLINKEW